MKNTLKIALTSALSTLTLLGLLAATPLARAGSLQLGLLGRL